MTSPTFDLNVHVEQMARLHGLTIDETWQAGIVANLEALVRAGQLVMAMELPDDIEPAPVFEA